MKIKGLRWWILGLIVLITIINYLDRGTLNYMWIVNNKMEYTLAENGMAGQSFATYDQSKNSYTLYNSAAKSNAEWFPVKQRALAQGLFGAGGSIGSVLAPIVISMLYLSFGWKSTFIIVGSLGIIWIIPWIIINKKLPQDHPWITVKSEKSKVEDDLFTFNF